MNEIIPAAYDTSLATYQDRAEPVSQSPSIVEKLMELAAMPGINPDMFDRLVAWQERERAAQAEEQFNDAMARCQGEIDPVIRDAKNDQTHSMYATLDAINQAIRPIYVRHGFSLSFGSESIEGANIRITCDVSRGRHTKRFYIDAPPDTLGPKGSAVKTVLHGIGSTMTYLRNKLTCGIFNVVLRNEDDDGVRGGKKHITETQADELRDLLRETGRQEGPFLDRLFAGAVRSVDEIEIGSGYLAAKSTLQGIKTQMAKKAGV